MTVLRHLSYHFFGFLWGEVLLRLYSGTPLFREAPVVLLFLLGLSALAALLPQAFARKRNIRQVLTALLLLASGILFTTEYAVFQAFGMYMSPENLHAGAGNVMEFYGGELMLALRDALIHAPLFLVPLLVFLGVILRERRKGRLVPAKSAKSAAGSAFPVAVRTRYISPDPSRIPAQRFQATTLLLGAVFLLSSAVSAGLALRGRESAVYGSQYNYNGAVQAFGMLDATRLDFQYLLFGNRYASFGGGPGPDDRGNDIPEASTPSDLAAGDSGSGQAEEEPAPKVYLPNAMDLDFSDERLNASKQTAALSAFLASRTPTMQNDYTGIFAGKNLIMICAESYCGTFLTPELTPTLWRLTHNGFYFSDYYQPSWGGSTTTGEMSLVLGLIGDSGDKSVIKTAGFNNYFSMGNQLQRLGYSSIAFHNGSTTYYRRDKTHENLGYNQFIASENGLKKICGNGYPTDTQMMVDTLPLYLDKAPFSVYYMTVSGHAPYEKRHPLVAKYYDRVNAAVGDLYEEKTKYYICYQMELENALAETVRILEEAGLADDTVIVLTGDHYPYGLGGGRAWGNDKNYLRDFFKAEDLTSWVQDRSSLIIWSGCLEHELKDMACEISDPTCSLDILPTVSNLFGVEFDSRLLPGRDVFSGTEPIAFWNNLSWVTREGKYDSRKHEFYPAEGREEDPGYVERIQGQVNDLLLMNREIVSSDYYGLLFGPDEVTFAGELLYDPETFVRPEETASGGQLPETDDAALDQDAADNQDERGEG
ncbi:MAG: LTA synthase family protein [Clostridium sp.]|nr:LTA synthase family protein [Clostridium sp.]